MAHESRNLPSTAPAVHRLDRVLPPLLEGRGLHTEGVKFLAGEGRLYWFIDLIASWQPKALQDPWLQEFQLWELRITEEGAVAVCLRDSDDEAFRQRLEFADSALDYVRLYVQNGIVMLPSEH